jgi:hypothetical protein
MNTGTIFDVAYLNEDNADLRLGQIELGDGTVASVPIHKGKDE